MKRICTLAAIGAAAIAIAGCGGSSDSAAPSTDAPAATETTLTTTTTAPAAAATTVSANTASEGDIASALETAGVKNAEKWADEVIEYRPYGDAATLEAKLRDELAKYNPAPDELERILAVLAP